MDTEQIIALVRHGETDWNLERRWQGRTGVALNETGRRQARAAVDLLQDRPWQWMITSPQLRAKETGALIRAGLGELPTDTDPDLVERDYGAADGMLSAEAKRRWPDGNFPESESNDLVGQRGAAALRRIAEMRSAPGIVVAHGGLLRVAINELCGIEAPRIINGSVSLLRPEEGRWQAVALNLLPDGDIAYI